MMMKNLTFLLSLLALLAGSSLIVGCEQPPNPFEIDPKVVEAQKKADDDTIQAYLSRRAITNFRRLNSGIYLVPVSDGPPANPLIRAGQRVTVNYVGKFINQRNESQVFDASSTNRTDCGCLSFSAGQPTQQMPGGIQEAIIEMRSGDSDCRIAAASRRTRPRFCRGRRPLCTPHNQAKQCGS